MNNRAVVQAFERASVFSPIPENGLRVKKPRGKFGHHPTGSV
jgi:hypothetical protein